MAFGRIVLLMALVTLEVEATLAPRPTPSPDTLFIASPSNQTVLEGDSAVLRCKISTEVYSCQWFYLERGLDVFDSRNTPKLVKHFEPSNKRDCSIKFSKAQLIQSGQWICKGLRTDSRKYVISNPALLEVLEKLPDERVPPKTDPPDHEKKISNDIAFQMPNEGHLINVRTGDTALLSCYTNKALESCSWIRPDGKKLPTFTDMDETYEIKGNLALGNCTLLVRLVSHHDEGNWRCVVSTFTNSDRLGPLIHLHLTTTDHNGHNGEFEGNFSGSSLVTIFVVTSLLLLIVVIILLFLMYKQEIWRGLRHSYLESNQSVNSEYGKYGLPWFPGNLRDDQLIDNLSTDQMSTLRYMDMTSNPTRGYVVFPATSSAASSRTALATIGKDERENTETKELMAAQEPSSHSFVEERLSVYSEGNIYEEIPERKSDEENLHEYMNTGIDNITPSSKTLEKAKTSSITDPFMRHNPTYSFGENVESPGIEHNSSMESYDAPTRPPVPIRTDSANTPLSTYDTPTSNKKL